MKISQLLQHVENIGLKYAEFSDCVNFVNYVRNTSLLDTTITTTQACLYLLIQLFVLYSSDNGYIKG